MANQDPKKTDPKKPGQEKAAKWTQPDDEDINILEILDEDAPVAPKGPQVPEPARTKHVMDRPSTQSVLESMEEKLHESLEQEEESALSSPSLDAAQFSQEEDLTEVLDFIHENEIKKMISEKQEAPLDLSLKDEPASNYKADEPTLTWRMEDIPLEDLPKSEPSDRLEPPTIPEPVVGTEHLDETFFDEDDKLPEIHADDELPVPDFVDPPQHDELSPLDLGVDEEEELAEAEFDVAAMDAEFGDLEVAAFDEDAMNAEYGGAAERSPFDMDEEVDPSRAVAEASTLDGGAKYRKEFLADDDEEPAIDFNDVEDEAPARLASAVGGDDDDMSQFVDDESEFSPRAEDEDELSAAGDDDEKPKKGKKERKPSRLMPALVGSFLGILLGAGGIIGAEMGGLYSFAPAPSRTGTGTGTRTQIAKPEFTKDDGIAFLNSGDLKRAREVFAAGKTRDDMRLAQIDWLLYQAQKATQGQAPSANDPQVQKVIKELKESDTAEGLMIVGQIEEAVGDFAKAEKTYQEGAGKFAKEKPLFDSALQRVKVLADDKAERGAMLIGPPWLGFIVGQVPEEEAGSSYWKAVQLARENKYDDALKELKAARDKHDKRRKLLPKQAQNPITDPNEDMFLKTCDELAKYWAMRKSLSDGGYLAKEPNAQKALDELVKSSKGAGQAATDLAKVMDALKKEKILPEDGKADQIDQALAQHAMARTNLEKELGGLKKVLTDEKYLSETQTDPVAGLKKALADKTAAQTAVNDVRNLLKDYITEENPDVDKALASVFAAKKKAEEGQKKAEGEVKTMEAKVKAETDKVAAADNYIKDVTKKLAAAKFTAADADRAETLKGLERAITQAGSVDPQGQIAKLKTELDAANARLKAVKTPEDTIGLWATLLESSDSKENNAAAAKDAEAVLANKSSSPAAKAQAAYVQALILKNDGNFAKARTALEQVAKMPNAPKGAAQQLKDISDPKAVFLPRIEQLEQSKQYDAARKAIDEALKIFPDQAGRLLAHRSLLGLEEAVAQGKVKAQEPLIAQAQKDAETALASGAPAQAHYAAGRLAEALGDYAKAADHYRAAIKALPAADPEINRYRLALARVLLQSPSKKPVEEKMGRAEEQTENQEVAFADEEPKKEAEPKDNPNLQEALKLADDVIKAGDPDGHLMKARVLAKMGMWSEALKEYLDGLEKRSKPDDPVRELRSFLERHPVFNLPDVAKVPDPLSAERFYASGLRNYWKRNYEAADKDFAEAVRNFNDDARYYYFLGLSRLAQDKKDDAFEAFRKGAELEKQGKPNSDTVNNTLERIQGEPRQLLNRYRK